MLCCVSVNKQNPCNASLTQSKVIEGEFSENLTRITNYTKPDEFSEESEMFTSVTCSKTAKEVSTNGTAYSRLA